MDTASLQYGHRASFQEYRVGAKAIPDSTSHPTLHKPNPTHTSSACVSRRAVRCAVGLRGWVRMDWGRLPIKLSYCELHDGAANSERVTLMCLWFCGFVVVSRDRLGRRGGVALVGLKNPLPPPACVFIHHVVFQMYCPPSPLLRLWPKPSSGRTLKEHELAHLPTTTLRTAHCIAGQNAMRCCCFVMLQAAF